MSYERKDLRVLSGSLDLRAPGDKIAPEDGLWMENWRVDSAGMLRGRGKTSDFAALGVAAVAHTIGRRGSTYYFGAANSLVRYDGATNPTISSAMSGQPFGVAAMNGWAWIMDSAVQGRDDGSTFRAWNIAAPATFPTPATGAANANGPNGLYQWWVTFANADGSVESNPSPDPGNAYTSGGVNGWQLTGENADLTGVPVSASSEVAARNIYRSGGALGQAYLVGTIADNTTTTFTDSMSDADAVTQGIALATDHDAPPPAHGIVGPYISRLLAFNSAANPNRLWWSKVAEPQYWPGAALATGQWVDVGEDGEAILAITLHPNVAMIYKERSIWRLVGDPDSGTLEQTSARMGIVGRHAAANAGAHDYCACADGIYKCNLDTLVKVSQKVDPIFLSDTVYTSAMIPVEPLDQSKAAAVALEFGGGRLYVSYAEAGASAAHGTNSCTLIYHEDSARWYGMRVNLGATPATSGFDSLYFNGATMLGASGAHIVAIDQTEAPDPSEWTAQPINLVYQSRYEDAGAPDQAKQWLECVIDCETNGDSLTITGYKDNGSSAGVASLALGTITNTERKKVALPFAVDGGNAIPFEATNMSIRITGNSTHTVKIHAIYLYYYVEAPLVVAAATLPLDFGTGKVKQAKELQLDIENNSAAIAATVASDLPGNALATVASLSLATGTTRRIYNLPFTVADGRLWSVAVGSASAFRLYHARLLMRVMGTYVEAHEAAGGFVWDSMEQDFSSGITHIPRQYAIALYANPIKRAREIELQIAAAGNVTVTLLSDLPGEAMASRFTATIAATSGRRVVRLPLPSGLSAPIEGRLFQLQLSGASKFILYAAAVEILPVGIYLEAYEAAGGAVYDSREVDLGSTKPKECREFELDFEGGPVTATLYSDLPGGVMASRYSLTTAATTGRQLISIPTTVNGALSQYADGRLFRLIVSGTQAFRLYGARLRVREYGCYASVDEALHGPLWDSTPTDLGAARDKVFDQLRFEIDCAAAVTVQVLTDLPGEALTQRYSGTFAPTATRRWVTVELPADCHGRLIQVLLWSTDRAKLFQAQVAQRSVGRYLAAGVPDALRTLETDLGTERVKQIKKLEADIQTDGALTLTLYTNQTGVMAAAYTTTINTGGSRQALKLPLPPAIRGRLARIEIGGNYSGRVYALRAWTRPTNEAQASWSWAEFPLEPSEALPQWAALPVPPTPPNCEWTPLPIAPTEPQWTWAKILSVEDTADQFEFVDVPFQVVS